MNRTPESAQTPDASWLSAESGRFDLFRWLPDDLRSEFLNASLPRTVPPGAIIYAQGDLATEMYRIVAGAVRLSVLRENGRELTYSIFGTSACFGISALIDRKAQAYTAIAHGEVRLEVLSLAAFRNLRARHRQFDEALLQALCGHVRVLGIYMGDASLDELPNRLARRLSDLAGGSAERSALALEISQADLATMLGASRQSVNSQLRHFEKAGLVRLSYGTVMILDRAGLAALAPY